MLQALLAASRVGGDGWLRVAVLGMAIVAGLLAPAPVVTAQVAAPPRPPLVSRAPEIDAKAHLLVDFHSGRVLSAFRPEARMHPASLTKIMTVYVALAEVSAGRVRLDDEVVVSARARSMDEGSRMFLEQGSRVGLRKLLKGIIIQSGNDASVAVAEHVSGNEAAFVKLMNRYAQALGMQRTHFSNPHGLTADEHYTTAADLALLARALITQFPEAYRWHREKSMTHNGITQNNRNRLLWLDDTVDGIKTGHTEAAGYCLVASAVRGSMRLVSVVLGAADKRSRTRASKVLLDYGFQHFETRLLYSPGQQVSAARVWKGTAEKVGLGLERPLYLTYPRGRYKELRAAVSVPERLLAPVASDTEIGELQIRLGEEVLAREPLQALQSVAEGGLIRRWTDQVKLWME